MADCSCIIPVHNEEKSGLSTLEKVAHIKELKKIVCVDDGSKDNSSKIIKEKCPQADLIRLNKNKGKTTAIRKGLKKIDTKYVLLLDADLKNLDKEEIKRAIKKLKENNPDMIMLKRTNAPFHLKSLRLNTLLSGERILKTSDLKEVLKKDCEGYEIEAAINNYMFKNKKKVFWSPNSGKNPSREEKWGKNKYPYSKMYINLLIYLGIISSIKQMVLFGRKRI